MLKPLFGKSDKSPADVVKNMKESLLLIDKYCMSNEKKVDKAVEEISKMLTTAKNFIYGSDAVEPNTDQVTQLTQEIYNSDVLPLLIKNLSKFEFETKKDVALVFNNLLRRQIGSRSPTVEYLSTRTEILVTLVMGYQQPDIALTCGSILRECIRHEHLAKFLLNSEHFEKFFVFVQSDVFDIATDAFSTFKDLLTKHKDLCSNYLDTNYDWFFGKYRILTNSSNYVTRRQSLKLLGELLLDRHNFPVMNRFITSSDNLKMIMELLREKRRNIQYEAFHVFKIFVANPNKPKPILEILNRNRDKLVDFLAAFHNDRKDDDQFNDEKAYLIKQIQDLRA